jgi:two-component system response regulator
MSEREYRVLVVDDNEATRLLIGRILRQELNVDAVLAGSAAEATHKLRRRRYDLILLDLLMPDVSGFEVLRFARSKESRNRATRILVLSVLGDAETIERCRELGATHHIVKPVLRESLAAAVRAHLPERAQGASANGNDGEPKPTA